MKNKANYCEVAYLSESPSEIPVGPNSPSPFSQSYFLRSSHNSAESSLRIPVRCPTQISNLNVLGRLQREVACVPRPASSWEAEGKDQGNQSNFWNAAVKLLLSHATRKQELEVGFENEEGTGLGPTMEFYALLSADLA